MDEAGDEAGEFGVDSVDTAGLRKLIRQSSRLCHVEMFSGEKNATTINKSATIPG